MSLHRFRLALEGPLGTPLSSGTLFGHLCWAMLRRQGEPALVAWLADLRAGTRHFLLSDAFPKDLLPRPLLPPFRQPDQTGTKEADEAKSRAKRPWVKRSDWLVHRGALSPGRLDGILTDWTSPAGDGSCNRGPPRHAGAKRPEQDVRRQPVRAVHAHNVIDRLTGTTPEIAGLWFVEDDWSFAAAAERDLYIDTDLPAAEVEALLAEVGAHGYGRDATYGRGLFRVLDGDLDRALADHAGNRLMSLAHGCLTPNMADARWERFTHFGKVGIEMALTGARPFKRPILLMKPGATFRLEGAGPFGALLEGVHQGPPDIVHHAWHLAIPYTEAAA